MSSEFRIAAVIVIGVIVYAIARVVQYARRSRQQWQQVDRSKLREWQDDDDW